MSLWKRPASVLAGMLLAIVGLERHAAAELYCYTDGNGIVHFTNVPADSRYKPYRSSPGSGRNDGWRSAFQSEASQSSPQSNSERDRFDETIEHASTLYNVPFALIKAVIKVESDFDVRAVSERGAKGLMQLMPETAADMGVADIFDPKQNIYGGSRYLRVLANMFGGDMLMVLAAYNAGHVPVERHGWIPPYEETEKFVGRALKFYYQFKRAPKLNAAKSKAEQAGEQADAGD